MHFAFDGFRHDRGKRCFLFRRVEAGAANSQFAIYMDMALLSRNGVTVQDAPLFCIRMLWSALESSESALEKFQQYEVGPEDFRELHAERAKRDAEQRERRSKAKSKLRPPHATLPPELFKPKTMFAV